jgi:hypothetical protein
METSYVDGLENRYVKITINEYKGLILSIYYNSEVKLWSNVSNECKICNSVKYKHKVNGICTSCYNKLDKFTQELGGYHKEPCNKTFEVTLNGFDVKADGEFVEFIPVKYKQLKIQFEEPTFCV